MNREKKRELLAQVTAVSANLTNDVGLIEHKVIQTEHDVETLERIIDNMKQQKDAVMADDYLAFNIVDSLGECMVHLSCTVAKLEHKVAALRLALEDVNEATTKLNFFVNRVPGIPTNE